MSGRRQPLPGAGPVDEKDGYATGWLDLREAADARSRSTDLLTAGLAAARRCREYQGGHDGPSDRPLHLLDVGCGTGAMARWVTASRAWQGDRTGHGDRTGQVRDGAPGWTLLEPDHALLSTAAERLTAAGATVRAAHAGTTDDLPRVLADAARTEPVDLVVASALLDVLPPAAVTRTATAVLAARVPLLVALTVTGEVLLDPPDPDDALARDRATATARGTGATGPGAADLLLRTGASLGARAHAAASPWRLDPGEDGPLLRAWWDGYAAAALAGGAPGAGSGAPEVLGRWTVGHGRLLAAGRLAVVVGHTDVLLLPVVGRDRPAAVDDLGGSTR